MLKKTEWEKFCRRNCVVLVLSGWILSAVSVRSGEQASSREESQFSINIAGKEVGKEKFTILTSAENISSSSILEFQENGKKGHKMRIETQLTTDAQFVPKAYQLKTDTDGQKGSIRGTFAPAEAMFEISGSGAPRKSGLLVGDHYQILDSNVFHHYAFIARAFDYNGNEKSQSFEVVVPQELDRGVLKVSNAGMEKTSLRGKTKNLYHLKADSGQLMLDLWVDEQRILHKIEIPAKKIEIIRMD
jgi:hypothetical protein